MSAAAVDSLLDWYAAEALPLWAGAGFDRDTGAFHEQLGFDRLPVATAPRRVMVQARQISVFAEAGLDGTFPPGADLAALAGRTLLARWRPAGDAPGWLFSIGPEPGRSVATSDLYAHAFVLYALAWLLRLGVPGPFRSAVDRSLDHLERDFRDPRHGGFWDALPRPDGLRRQNPHMHLFEALLELSVVLPDERIARLRDEVLDLALARFVDPEAGTVRELFHEDWTVAPAPGLGSVEPGHQMEWAWLLDRHAAITGRACPGLPGRLVAAALATGVDPATGRVVDETGEDGAVRKRSSRLWPHCEALKALVAEAAAGGMARAALVEAMAERLRRCYAVAELGGGWIDQLDEVDRPVSRTMPASTLYHLAGAIRSLRSWRRAAVPPVPE
ncbi:AGE family epimerase/isomerase [Prosthecomicrobium sp. N25]|uniref:AGE family epimerase/isomerase n=1 Tax=Prosthecomicrobium sp. N25 TaxID=3129254 RepID=UPI003076AC9F